MLLDFIYTLEIRWIAFDACECCACHLLFWLNIVFRNSTFVFCFASFVFEYQIECVQFFCAFIWCWPFCFKVFSKPLPWLHSSSNKRNLYICTRRMDTSKTMPFNQNYKLYNKTFHRKSFSDCVCLQLKISQYTQCTIHRIFFI